MFVYNDNGLVYSTKYTKQDINESQTTKQTQQPSKQALWIVWCFLHGLHRVVANTLKKTEFSGNVAYKNTKNFREYRHSTKAKSMLMKA